MIDDLEKRLREIRDRKSGLQNDKMSAELEKLKEKNARLESKLEKMKKGSNEGNMLKNELPRKTNVKAIAEYAAMAGAFAAEFYYLALPYHSQMYSLTKYWYTGYGNFGVGEQHYTDFINQGIRHLFCDGLAGFGVGALIGLAFGGTIALTYNVIKRNFFPFVSTCTTAMLTGGGAAVGGLLGGEFSNPNGIMIGSYVGGALALAALTKAHGSLSEEKFE